MGRTDVRCVAAWRGRGFERRVAFLPPAASESRLDSAASLTGANGSSSISMSVEINGVMYTGSPDPAPWGRPGSTCVTLAGRASTCSLWGLE